MYNLAENSVEKSIETWKIIIPLSDNDKNEFAEEIIAAVKSRIIDEFGGLTEVSVVGQWQSGNELLTDRNIQVIVDIPVKDHKRTNTFFINLKDELRIELRQHKIYVTFEKAASELLSFSEFLQELGFEVSSDQLQQFRREDIQRLIEEFHTVQKRLGYRTVSLIRDSESKSIVWEREILGMRLCTNIADNYSPDAVLLSADRLEDYFTKDNFGKPLIVVGDYEYQSFILDKEKRRRILQPELFLQCDKGNEEFRFYHIWHGALKTSEFVVTFVEELLINYIILRENRQEQRITMSVGSDGSVQFAGGLVLRCPAHIPRVEVQTAIIDGFIKAKNWYETNTIDEIALMQVKALNRYNEKKALIRGSSTLTSNSWM